jgi:hypothetical protein
VQLQRSGQAIQNHALLERDTDAVVGEDALECMQKLIRADLLPRGIGGCRGRRRGGGR